MKRQWAALTAGLLTLAVGLAGCSRVQTSTAPMWDEQSAREAAMNPERVNVWPLLYWNNPALSVLWPLVAANDEGHSVTPFYEYRHEQGELRVGNPIPIAPPLLAHSVKDEQYLRVLNVVRDGKEQDLMVFPFYYQSMDPQDPQVFLVPLYNHTKDGVWTPLYTDWRLGGDERMQGILGPLLNRHASPDGPTRWNLPWPLAGWWSGGPQDAKGAKLLPVFYYNQQGGQRVVNVCIAFFGFWDGDDCAVYYPFPLASHGCDGGARWNYCMPLWVWCDHDEEENFYSLPFVHMADGTETTTLVTLLAYLDTETGHSRRQLLLGGLLAGRGYDERDASRWNYCVPLWFRSRDKDKENFYSLPLIHTANAAETSTLVMLLGYQDKQTDHSREQFVLGGLLAGRGYDESNASRWNYCVPLWSDWTRGKEGMLTSLPYIRVKDGDKTLRLFMLNSYVNMEHKNGQQRYQSVAWPLLHRFEDKDSQGHAVAPFYLTSAAKDGSEREFYSAPLSFKSDGSLLNVGLFMLHMTDKDGRVRGTALWPLAHWWKNEQARGSALAPVYYWNDKGEAGKKLLTPLGWRIEQDGQRTLDVAGPLFYDRTTNDGQSAYRSVMWPLAHWWKNEQARGSALAPVYYWNDEGEAGKKLLTPLGWRIEQDGQRTLDVAGPLFYDRATSDGQSSYRSVMWPLYHRWIDGERQGQALLPLFGRETKGEDEQFFACPLGGWSRTPQGSALDVAGPLFYASRSADGQKEHQAALWPLWNKHREGDEKWSALLPLFFTSTSPTERLFASIPYYHCNGEGETDTALALNLIGWGRDERRSEEGQLRSTTIDHHVAPFYSWESTRAADPLECSSGGRFEMGLGSLAEIYWTSGDMATMRERMCNSMKQQIEGQIESRDEKVCSQNEAGLANTPDEPWKPEEVSDYEYLSQRWMVLGLNKFWQRLKATGRPLKPGEAVPAGQSLYTDSQGRRWAFDFELRASHHIPVLYNYRLDARGQERQILWRLYDSKTTAQTDGSPDHVYQRVLWRLLHRQADGQHVSTDAFPFITYDRDGDEDWMQWSLAGGLTGYKREANGAKTLRLLWLPLHLSRGE